MRIFDLANVAGVAALLRPISHMLKRIRLDLDSKPIICLLLRIFWCCLGHQPSASGIHSRRCSRNFNCLRLLLAASLLTGIGVYRTYLHPLKGFPRPFWGCFSVFWKVKSFKESDFKAFRIIDSLLNRFGGVVRLGSRQLSMNEPSIHQTIYYTSSICHRLAHLEYLRMNLQILMNIKRDGMSGIMD